MFERAYKGVSIRVVREDITLQTVDAIVNPANSQMIMGGGVAGAIKRTGGKEIEEEAVRHAPVPVGKAEATKAGRLNAKYIIHTPTMRRPTMRITKENVRLAMKAALENVEKLKAKSVAFPGLGTGVGGVDIKAAANIMLQELKTHISGGTSLQSVIFVGFTEKSAEAFRDALKKTMVE